MRAVSVVLLTLLLAATVSAADPPADEAAAINPLERFAEPVVPLPRARFDGGRFAVRPGEVVVLTGPANAVFEQQQGWFETMLALSAARQQPSVRHMSWEGDTVYEQARRRISADGPSSSRRSAHRQLLPGLAGSKRSMTAEITMRSPRPTTSCLTNSPRRRHAWSSSRRHLSRNQSVLGCATTRPVMPG